jgi:hypothetical protein
MDPISEAQIDNWFSLHPATEVTGPLHDEIRGGFRDLAHHLDDLIPHGPDLTLAIRKLQEAMWAANSAIACAPRESNG